MEGQLGRSSTRAHLWSVLGSGLRLPQASGNNKYGDLSEKCIALWCSTWMSACTRTQIQGVGSQETCDAKFTPAVEELGV